MRELGHSFAAEYQKINIDHLSDFTSPQTTIAVEWMDMSAPLIYWVKQKIAFYIQNIQQ